MSRQTSSFAPAVAWDDGLLTVSSRSSRFERWHFAFEALVSRFPSSFSWFCLLAEEGLTPRFIISLWGGNCLELFSRLPSGRSLTLDWFLEISRRWTWVSVVIVNFFGWLCLPVNNLFAPSETGFQILFILLNVFLGLYVRGRLTISLTLWILKSFLLHFFDFLVHCLVTLPKELFELRLVVDVGLFSSDGTVESFGLRIAHSGFDAFDGFPLALHTIVFIYKLWKKQHGRGTLLLDDSLLLIPRLGCPIFASALAAAWWFRLPLLGVEVLFWAHGLEIRCAIIVIELILRLLVYEQIDGHLLLFLHVPLLFLLSQEITWLLRLSVWESSSGRWIGSPWGDSLRALHTAVLCLEIAGHLHTCFHSSSFILKGLCGFHRWFLLCVRIFADALPKQMYPLLVVID